MKMSKITMRTARSIILSLALMLLAACAPQTPQVGVATLLAEMQTMLASATPTPVLRSLTTQSVSAAPSIELAETATPTPFDSPTPPPTGTATPTAEVKARFAVIGDFGSGSQAQTDVANLVKSWNPDFIVTTGDNNYPTGSADTIDRNIGRDYYEFIYPYLGSYGESSAPNRFFPSLGNHDWDAPNAQPYLDYFTLPGNERYYDFTWGPVHFFIVNSDPREPDGASSSSYQALWLKDALGASDSTWKIVVLHASPYSSGTHGGTPWMRWPFAEWGASAVLGGHDHNYERLHIDGIPYFVNGLGGGAIYRMKTPVDGSQIRYNQDYGAMLVEADRQQINFQFITRWGEVIDNYSLNAVD